MALLTRIYRLAGQGAQFVIATHSPLLIACPGADVYELGEAGPRLTPYGQTAHYQIFRHFLNKPEDMLRVLLEEE